MSTVDNIKKHSVKNDLVAGIVVFLIALPLCLGIAQASQAPLFSGIIAGVIGGIVIGFFQQEPPECEWPGSRVGIYCSGSHQ
ncbi:MAG: hypothetical protein KL787_01955 [Taibaiella sp.]|nr:hypothetical protein [Taibaiella sp.]